jgi:hypothetical protein
VKQSFKLLLKDFQKNEDKFLSSFLRDLKIHNSFTEHQNINTKFPSYILQDITIHFVSNDFKMKSMNSLFHAHVNTYYLSIQFTFIHIIQTLK